MWDFGGQDIYHGTHALFMRTRAVFLLVWTPVSEQGDHEHGGMVFRNRPLPYWLEYIRYLGGDRSPVILVQNQCDGGLGEYLSLPVAEELLAPLCKDGRLFTRVAYSAKDETGRPRLLDALQQAVRQLREIQGQPMMGRNRLAVWEQLRNWRDQDARETDATRRRHRLLPYQEFADLCRKQGGPGRRYLRRGPAPCRYGLLPAAPVRQPVDTGSVLGPECGLCCVYARGGCL